MKTTTPIAIVVFGACTFASCSTSRSAAPPPPAMASAPAPAPTPVTVAETAVSVTATVEKIDHKTRMVTLRGPDGKSQTIKVSDDVKNLPQVKVGDQVVVAYYESLAYQVKKPGQATPGVGAAQELATAEPGQRPAGVGATVVTITATITAIDPSVPSVTLTGPEGNSRTFKVRDPKRLENVKVGDLVEINYTEAVAISVQPASK